MKKKFSIPFILFAIVLIFSSSLAYYISAMDLRAVVVHRGKLPVVGSFDKLQELLKETEKKQRFIYNDRFDFGMAVEEKSADSASAGLAKSDHSTTNVQVDGVDEADIVKTDGEYIYQIHHSKVVIMKASPVKDMKVVKTIEYKQEEFYPTELYIDKGQMIVIGFSHKLWTATHEKSDKMSMPYYGSQTTKIIVYNTEDLSNIHIMREAEMEGGYVSSRKIGSSVYLVTNKYIDMHPIIREDKEVPPPSYRDSSSQNGGKFKTLSYGDIYYFPGSSEPNYLIIGSIDIANAKKEMKVSAYLGSGQQIYASTKNLYVAVTKYENSPAILDEGSIQRSTDIFKFSLDNGNVTFRMNGNVPGNILNQFSMDEHNGYLRLATTTGQLWSEGQNESKNHLYILNSQLKVAGKIEDIAPGERIYSVRFMGDRGYMVTFKTVDPLFVLDLKDPTSPSILGELKIPGYSDYLHPYDENHIIGFGKDAIEVENQSKDVAYYQGMKVALFDITDVNNPKEKFVEMIGDRGTDSELLYNHKALLFSKEKNLLAFPVTLMEVKDKKNPLDYGRFTFQGAYVYDISLDKGFKLRKRITHLDPEDYMHNEDYSWYNMNLHVERVLYIGDTLYTLSKGKLVAHDMKTMKEVKLLKIFDYKENQ